GLFWRFVDPILSFHRITMRIAGIHLQRTARERFSLHSIPRFHQIPDFRDQMIRKSTGRPGHAEQSDYSQLCQ
ncbi:MAG: hypothetical protein RBU29_13110, partial [bacterium]|nr:hypothetical protein [bacterium]